MTDIDVMTDTEASSVSFNVWNYKPWWCQPWSIVLTGIGLILGSWFLLHRFWVTSLVAMSALGWMGFFLLVWPGLVARSLTSSSSLEACSVLPISDTAAKYTNDLIDKNMPPN